MDINPVMYTFTIRTADKSKKQITVLGILLLYGAAVFFGNYVSFIFL